MARAAILDVDGTLVDTNYHHAIAWFRAFRQHGIALPIWRIHRHIGMGGDKVVAALAGDEVEDEQGDDIRGRARPTSRRPSRAATSWRPRSTRRARARR